MTCSLPAKAPSPALGLSHFPHLATPTPPLAALGAPLNEYRLVAEPADQRTVSVPESSTTATPSSQPASRAPFSAAATGPASSSSSSLTHLLHAYFGRFGTSLRAFLPSLSHFNIPFVARRSRREELRNLSDAGTLPNPWVTQLCAAYAAPWRGSCESLRIASPSLLPTPPSHPLWT